MSREEALRLYTQGSSWFSAEEDVKGSLTPGQLADFAVLTSDFFTVPEQEIKDLQSVLTVVGGEVVYASEDFSQLAPPPLPAALDWAPTAHYGGYYNPVPHVGAAMHYGCSRHHASAASRGPERVGESLWGLGCDCFAF